MEFLLKKGAICLLKRQDGQADDVATSPDIVHLLTKASVVCKLMKLFNDEDIFFGTEYIKVKNIY